MYFFFTWNLTFSNLSLCFFINEVFFVSVILFNAMFLHEPLQNVLIFNILTNFTLLLLVCFKFYYKTCGTMTSCFKHHENLLCFLFNSFLTCNVLKITSSISMEDFNLNFKVFILITTYLVFCLRNKRFVATVQKFCHKGRYWIKPGEALSFLVHFILFAIFITFLLVKYYFLLYWKAPTSWYHYLVLFKYRTIVVFLFLTFDHERVFENYLSVNRSFFKISFQNNIFNNDFNNFSVFLTNFNSFSDFKVCSKAPLSDVLCHLEATQLTFNESQLTGFSMIWVLTERRLKADFYFSLNVNVNVAVASYVNSTSREMILHNVLQKWIDLNISRTIKPERTSKAALFETNSQILLFLYSFSVYFWSISVIRDWHIS